MQFVRSVSMEGPMKSALRLVANLVLRLALITVLVTLIEFLVTLILGLPAQAEDLGAGEIQIGARLVCNTQHEAFRFVKLYSGDAEATLKIVNAEQNDPQRAT
jgi:hypothetical protein